MRESVGHGQDFATPDDVSRGDGHEWANADVHRQPGTTATGQGVSVKEICSFPLDPQAHTGDRTTRIDGRRLRAHEAQPGGHRLEANRTGDSIRAPTSALHGRLQQEGPAGQVGVLLGLHRECWRRILRPTKLRGPKDGVFDLFLVQSDLRF